MAPVPVAPVPVSAHDRVYRNYYNSSMSFWRYLFNNHNKRIETTISDYEDRPVLQSDVSLPCAPKKNRERGMNTSMPGGSANIHRYYYQPGPNSGYNAERVLLQEQQDAKKIRRKNRKRRRLQPASRKRLQFDAVAEEEAEEEAEASTSGEAEADVAQNPGPPPAAAAVAASPREYIDIGINGFGFDGRPADIGWTFL